MKIPGPIRRLLYALSMLILIPLAMLALPLLFFLSKAIEWIIYGDDKI